MQKQALAERFINVVPRSMGAIRFEMRKHIPKDLSLTQFRVLAQLSKGPQTGSELAGSIGLSLPAISRMVDLLEKRGLLQRDRSKTDRRQISVFLTGEGKMRVDSLVQMTERNFMSRLNELTADETQSLFQGLEILERLNHVAGDGGTAP